MLYPFSLTIDGYIQADSMEEAERKLDKIVTEVETCPLQSNIDLEFNQVEQLEVSDSNIINQQN